MAIRLTPLFAGHQFACCWTTKILPSTDVHPASSTLSYACFLLVRVLHMNRTFCGLDAWTETQSNSPDELHVERRSRMSVRVRRRGLTSSQRKRGEIGSITITINDDNNIKDSEQGRGAAFFGNLSIVALDYQSYLRGSNERVPLPSC